MEDKVQTLRRKKQLEGIGLAEKLMNDLLKIGLGTVKWKEQKEFERQAKQLGDYYLPELQNVWKRIIKSVEKYQVDKNEKYLDQAIQELKLFRALSCSQKEALGNTSEEKRQEQGRIHWREALLRLEKETDFHKIKGLAAVSLKEEVQRAKSGLKGVVNEPLYVSLIAYEMLGIIGNKPVLVTASGETAQLADYPGLEACTDRVCFLLNEELAKNQALLGAFFYDEEEQRIKLHPLSIITETGEYRLIYVEEEYFCDYRYTEGIA